MNMGKSGPKRRNTINKSQPIYDISEDNVGLEFPMSSDDNDLEK